MTQTSSIAAPSSSPPPQSSVPASPPVRFNLAFQFNPNDQFSLSSDDVNQSRLSSHQRQQRLFIKTYNLRSHARIPPPLSSSPPLGPTSSSAIPDLPSTTASASASPSDDETPASTSPQMERFERLQSLRHPIRPLTSSSHHFIQPLKYQPAKPLSFSHHPFPTHASVYSYSLPSSTAPPHLTPSSAFMTMSKLISPSTFVNSAVSLSSTTSDYLPRRPREGEVSRFGAYNLDSFCPVVVAKKAARAVFRPLQSKPQHDSK